MTNSTTRATGNCRRLVATALLLSASAAAVAQSPQGAAEPPDYAAILGESLTTTDAVTGERRKLNAAEVEAVAVRRGTHRTRDQRRRAAHLNRALQDMPATVEESVARSTRSTRGTMREVSLEEMSVLYGRIGPDGKMYATHDPGDAPDDNRAR